MKSTLACAAARPAVSGAARGETAGGYAPPAAPPESSRVRGLGFSVQRLKQISLAVCLACAATVHPAFAASALDTDTPIWRATHGLLLGLSRAGTRLVAVGTGGNVLLSDDEGQTWRAASRTPTQELLTSVVFPTSNEGWAVGQDELILHTTDGGETWTQQHIAADADQTMFSIISLGGSHLLATGAYNLTLESFDGSSWNAGKIPDTDDDYHLNCAVARGGDVLVTGESGHAFIRYAGAWTPMKLPYDGSQFACLVSQQGDFWSFGLRGSAFKSEPGATDWTRIETGQPYSIFGATNLSDGRMALVGSNGLMMLMDPATGKVTVLRPVTGKTMSAVVEGQGGKLIVVGEDGVHLIDPSAQQTGDDQ